MTVCLARRSSYRLVEVLGAGADGNQLGQLALCIAKDLAAATYGVFELESALRVSQDEYSVGVRRGSLRRGRTGGLLAVAGDPSCEGSIRRCR